MLAGAFYMKIFSMSVKNANNGNQKMKILTNSCKHAIM